LIMDLSIRARKVWHRQMPPLGTGADVPIQYSHGKEGRIPAHPATANQRGSNSLRKSFSVGCF
jgi:hypothetical protein